MCSVNLNFNYLSRYTDCKRNHQQLYSTLNTRPQSGIQAYPQPPARTRGLENSAYNYSSYSMHQQHTLPHTSRHSGRDTPNDVIIPSYWPYMNRHSGLDTPNDVNIHSYWTLNQRTHTLAQCWSSVVDCGPTQIQRLGQCLVFAGK